MNQEQKELLIKASRAAGLSYSSFMRQAAIEKINRMASQTNTAQSTNLEMPRATHDLIKSRGCDE